ncbi:MAG: protein kinase domain-containing protein [Myxococcota bacterium]
MPTLGSFTLLQRIGRGGAGEVWRARHAGGALVAVKVLRDPGDAALGEAFRREVRAAAALDHPGVVRVLDHGETAAGAPWMAMELCEGGTLGQAAATIDWPGVRDAAGAVLDALAHAHARGVIHRDLKPGNVLRGADGRWRLADFGIARLRDHATKEGFAVGTPSYMAPEQVQNRSADQGPWTDLYALGCTIWAVLTGSPPFGLVDGVRAAASHLWREPPPFRPRVPVPPEVEPWLRRLLEKEPADRPACAADARLPEMTAEGRASPAPPPLLVGAGLRLFGLRTPPFTGRDAERDRLQRALARVTREGRARAVVIRGPSGCGKSRLAAWVGERADEAGLAAHLVATHEALGGARDGVGPMLARHLRVERLAGSALRARVGDDLPGIGRLPDPDAVCALLTPDDAAVRFAAPSERYVVVRRALAAMAGRRPLVVRLEDVQWGLDALLCCAALLGAPMPVLFVLTAQEEALATRPAEAHALARVLASPDADALALGPLPEGDHAALVRQLLALEPSLAAEVVHRTAGNPLFAVHLVGDWVARGRLAPGEHGFVRVGTGPLPDDLHAVWSDAVARALLGRPEGDGVALELAAALGGSVDAREWAAVCEARGIRPTAGLADALAERRLARPERDGGFSFAHAMLRECLERRAREAGRWLSHHAACAAVLEARPAKDPVRLGRHLARAGEAERAIPSLLRGLDDLVSRSELAAAQAILGEAEGLAEALGDARVSAEVRVRAAEVAQATGRPADAGRIAAEVADVALAEGWVALRGRALVTRALALRVTSWRDAIAHLSHAEGVLEAGGDLAGLAQCRPNLAAMLARTGDYEGADARLDAVSAWARAAGDAYTGDRARFVRGMTLVLRGRHAEARVWLGKAADAFAAGGHRRMFVNASMSLGDAFRFDGRLADAERHYRAALEVARQLDHPSLTVIAEWHFAVLRLESGDAAGALPELRRSLAALGPSPGPWFSLPLNASLLAASARTGDVAGATATLARVHEDLEKSGANDPEIARFAAMAAEGTDDRRLARACAELALSQWRVLGREAEALAVEAFLRD